MMPEPSSASSSVMIILWPSALTGSPSHSQMAVGGGDPSTLAERTNSPPSFTSDILGKSPSIDGLIGTKPKKAEHEASPAMFFAVTTI